MVDTLKDVCVHFQGRAFGRYAATVTDNDVIIETKFEKRGGPKVTMSYQKWDRLVAWVEWRRKDRSNSN